MASFFRTYGPLAAFLTVLLAVTPANAAIVTTYTSAQALVNASESPAQITFEEIVNEGPYNNYSELNVSTTYGSVGLRGWKSSSTRENLTVPQNPSPTWTGKYLNQDGNNPSTSPHISVVVPAGVYFAGMNLMRISFGNVASDGVRIQVTDVNDNVYIQDVPTLSTTGSTNGYANAAFLGFRFDVPIARWDVYQYTGTWTGLAIDNIYLAQNAFTEPPPPPPPTGTPDPATQLLCGGGILLFISRKMRKHLQARQVAI
ncbi:MAG: hypothetical protein ACKV22_26230 [Bryobacteraceae bacterium]